MPAQEFGHHLFVMKFSFSEDDVIKVLKEAEAKYQMEGAYESMGDNQWRIMGSCPFTVNYPDGRPLGIVSIAYPG